jgi:hypothetical protein
VTSPPPRPYSVAPGPIANSEPAEVAEPPFSPAPIQELLRLIVKAARAHQLYLPNNPIYQGAINALRAGFVPVWAETDEIELTITEGEISWCDVVVSDGSASASRSADNLAWLFYKDGLRELRLMKGFEDEEVVRFLTIIQRARKGSVDEDDLVTMLWEADFTLLQYKYVDLLHDGDGGDDLADGGDGAPSDPGDVRKSAQEAVEESRASGLVNMADFDATLYFLDEREIEYLQAEITREYAQNLRVNVVAALLDIFEAQADVAVRAEAVEDIETLMVHLLTAGDFHGVAYVLREVRSAVGRAPELAPESATAIGALADRLSAPESLSQLLQALDEALTLPPSDELSDLFAELRPTALGTVFSWLGRSQNERLRPVLESAAERLAAANTAELVRLIQSPDADVSAEAIRRAGGLKAQAAVLSLGKVLAEPDVQRRQIAVHALAEIASAGALQALERAVEDSDRDVRITAVRALGAKAYRPVLSRLEGIVRGKAVRDADRTEKMAIFEAYGAVCGDAGVPHLDAILNGKGFLGRREDPEIRACAAIALGRIGSAKAAEVLQKSAAEKDIVVRSAVNRALRGQGASA